MSAAPAPLASSRRLARVFLNGGNNRFTELSKELASHVAFLSDEFGGTIVFPATEEETHPSGTVFTWYPRIIINGETETLLSVSKDGAVYEYAENEPRTVPLTGFSPQTLLSLIEDIANHGRPAPAAIKAGE